MNDIEKMRVVGKMMLDDIHVENKHGNFSQGTELLDSMVQDARAVFCRKLEMELCNDDIVEVAYAVKVIAGMYDVVANARWYRLWKDKELLAVKSESELETEFNDFQKKWSGIKKKFRKDGSPPPRLD